MSDSEERLSEQSLRSENEIPEGITYPHRFYTLLSELFTGSPRVENAYYGPFNGILSSMFPPDATFMVKPQEVFHPVSTAVSSTTLPPGAEPHPQATRNSDRIAQNVAAHGNLPSASYSHNPNQSSIDSIDVYGTQVISRKLFSNHGEGDLIPDFVITRTADGSSLQNVILAVLEVKNNNLTATKLDSAIIQMEEYLYAVDLRPHDEDFVGFLAVGDTCYVYKTPLCDETGFINNSVAVVRTGGPEWVEHLEPLQQGDIVMT